MKFTKETEYGLRMVYHLSMSTPRTKIISSREMSEHQRIPHLFSLRIIKKLEKAGILEVFKGVHGGSRLKKDIKRITLKDIIEAIDGKICFTEEIGVKGDCNPQYEKSGIKKKLQEIEKEFLKRLSSVTMHDIVQNSKKNEK